MTQLASTVRSSLASLSPVTESVESRESIDSTLGISTGQQTEGNCFDIVDSARLNMTSSNFYMDDYFYDGDENSGYKQVSLCQSWCEDP